MLIILGIIAAILILANLDTIIAGCEYLLIGLVTVVMWLALATLGIVIMSGVWQFLIFIHLLPELTFYDTAFLSCGIVLAVFVIAQIPTEMGLNITWKEIFKRGNAE